MEREEEIGSQERQAIREAISSRVREIISEGKLNPLVVAADYKADRIRSSLESEFMFRNRRPSIWLAERTYAGALNLE